MNSGNHCPSFLFSTGIGTPPFLMEIVLESIVTSILPMEERNSSVLLERSALSPAFDRISTNTRSIASARVTRHFRAFAPSSDTDRHHELFSVGSTLPT